MYSKVRNSIRNIQVFYNLINNYKRINYLDEEFRLFFVLFLFLIWESISVSDDLNTSGVDTLNIVGTIVANIPNTSSDIP